MARGARGNYHEPVFVENGPVSRFLAAQNWFRLGVLTLAALFLGKTAWDHTWALLRHQPLGIDFLPMWAGARVAFFEPERLYDFVGLTHLVHPLAAPFHGLRPFVYPPPALIAFAPFAMAPFHLANLIWTAIGALVLVWTMAYRLTAHRVLLLVVMLLTPPSVLVMVTGQVTFLIAALTVLGLVSLKDRPWLAGALLGVAGSIKPQAMVLLPVALIAVWNWRALMGAALAATAITAASLSLFGSEAWIEWLAAMPRFEHFVMDQPALTRGMITPTSLGMWMGLGPDALWSLRILVAVAALAMVWFVFRRTESLPRRLAALLGGALFVTPYAMHYDAALLAPAVALLLARPAGVGGWILALAAGALLSCAGIPHWGAVAVTAVIPLVALGGESRAPDRFLNDLVVLSTAVFRRSRVPA